MTIMCTDHEIPGVHFFESASSNPSPRHKLTGGEESSITVRSGAAELEEDRSVVGGSSHTAVLKRRSSKTTAKRKRHGRFTPLSLHSRRAREPKFDSAGERKEMEEEREVMEEKEEEEEDEEDLGWSSKSVKKLKRY